MKTSFEEDGWGFFIHPESLLTEEIASETDVPEGAVIVKKIKQHIEDLGRTVVNTSYYLVQGETEHKENKNAIKKYLAEKMLDYLTAHSEWAPFTTLKKKHQRNYRLNYQPNKHDSFELTIQEDQLGGKSLATYFANLNPSAVVEDQSWPVEGSQGKTYTVTKKRGDWECSCPQWAYRGRRSGTACKHIQSIKARK